MQLIAHIGSARDLAPAAMLLADPDVCVAYSAAETLTAIGDRRALFTFDVWVACHPGRDARGLREEFVEFREALRQRLDSLPLLPIAPPPRPVAR